MTAWYSDAEYSQLLANAAAARMAPAAFVAQASLTAPAAPATASESAAAGREVWRELLLALLGVHRQLRGACTNLNQAVAKLNTLGEPVGELPAIAGYVRRVTTAVDEAIAVVRTDR